MQKSIFTFVCCIFITILYQNCSKEARKVDINDGTENPINRKLQIEVTHRYNSLADSLLPNVAVFLYETEDDESLGRYYRRDTTGTEGLVVFPNLKGGTLRLVLQHDKLGSIQAIVDLPANVVTKYEYFHY